MRVPTGFAVVKAFRDVGGEGDPSFVSAGLAATGSVRYVFDVSGYSEASVKERSKEAGFDEYFVKPVNAERLLALISAAHQRRNTNGASGHR